MCFYSCVCAVRPDAGGVGRAQRELNTRGGARTRRQRPAAQVHPQRLRYPGPRRNRTLPTLPHPGYFCFIFLRFFPFLLPCYLLTTVKVSLYLLPASYSQLPTVIVISL